MHNTEVTAVYRMFYFNIVNVTALQIEANKSNLLQVVRVIKLVHPYDLLIIKSKHRVTPLGTCTVTDKFSVNVLQSQRSGLTGKTMVTLNVMDTFQ